MSSNYANPAKYPGVVTHPALDSNSDPVAWKAAMVTELKSFAPMVAQEIETGANELDRICEPMLEIVTKKGRKFITNNAAVYATLSIHDQALPTFHDPPPADQFVNWADSKFFYSIERQQEFIGEGGKSRFDSILRNNQLLRMAFKKEKAAAYAHITNRITNTIQSKIEIPQVEYQAMRTNNDYMTLIGKAEMAVSGGGVRAVGQWLIKLTQINIKFHEQNHILFFRQFNEVRNKLWAATQTLPPGTDFRVILFNVMFTFAMSKAEHPLIQMRMQNNLSANIFEDVDALQAYIMTGISTLEGIQGVSEDYGVIYNANATNVKSRHTSNNSTSEITCFNCGRNGHFASKCYEKLGKCSKCGHSGHIASMHELATEARKKYEARKSTPSYQYPAADSPVALLARQSKQSITKKIMSRKPIVRPFAAHNATVENGDETENRLYEYLMMQNNGYTDENNDDMLNSSVPAYNASVTNEVEEEQDYESYDPDCDEEEQVPIHSYVVLVDIEENSCPDLAPDSDSENDSDADSMPDLAPDYDSDDEDFMSDFERPCGLDSDDLVSDDEDSMPGIASDSDSDDEASVPETVRAYITKSSQLTNQSGPIYATIDTGSQANLIKDIHIHHSAFKNVKVCTNNTNVTGISATAAPIKVTHTGTHSILGHVLFGDFSINLIGVPELMKNGLTLHCSDDRMEITRSANSSLIYTGYRNKHNLYECDINVTTSVINAYNVSLQHDVIPSEIQRMKVNIMAFPNDLISPGIVINTPMHEREIERAKQARNLHDNLGHPSDDVLKAALNNNLYIGIDLVPKDVDNSYKLFGKCPACLEGKMREPVHAASKIFQSDLVGEVLYGDIKQSKIPCISGHTQMMVFRDYYSGYITVIGMKDKSLASVMNAINTVIAFYSTHSHKVRRLVFDHESVLKCVENKIPNIITSYTPAGLHNRFVERAIQDILQRKLCAEADLPYILDKRLEIVAMENAAKSSNRVPNERTGNSTTPYMLVHGRKADVPPFRFGQCLLAYIRAPNKPKRVEYTIFLNHDQPNDFIVFNPITGNVLSRSHVIVSDVYPKDWKLEKRPVLINGHYDRVPDLKFSSNADMSGAHLAPSPDHPEQLTQAASVNPISRNLPSITHLIPSIYSTVPNSAEQSPKLFASTSEAATVTDNDHYERINPMTAQPIPDVISIPMQPVPIIPILQSTRSSRQSIVPTIEAVPIRQSNRVKVPNRNIYDGNHIVHSAHVSSNIKAFRISMKQAMNDPDSTRVESASKAMLEELKQLIDMGTFIPVPIDKMPLPHRSKIIPSFIFFKEKFRADGSFDKWKARLVAGGNFIDTSQAGDISAQVVNPITVMTMLSVAASLEFEMITADVKSAFLIPELSEEPSELTYIRIDKQLTKLMISIKPSWSKLMNRDGTMTMKLLKALYGLPLAAMKWMNHLNETLIKLGFEATDADKCCYTRGSGANKIILCFHVDDILAIAKKVELDKFVLEIKKEYDINIEQGYKHSYIGLDIKKNARTGIICVGQTGYKREVLNRFKDLISRDRSEPRVPCGEDILSEPNLEEELVDKTEYLSLIMSIMYLARFTRPDLSFACGMLATHSGSPRYSHLKQAIKLLKYIASNDDYVIHYKPQNFNPEIFADASHGVHHDGKGHGCLIVKIGGGLVYVRSYKLKLVTLSSTESEWVVLCEAACLAQWIMSLFDSFDYALKPIIVRQDNTSSIWLAEHGANFARTKHLLIKKNKAKESILNGTITIRFTPTEFMVADLGTKPLSRRILLLHLKNIGMLIAVSENGKLVRLDDIKVPAARVQRRPEASSNGATSISNTLARSETTSIIASRRSIIPASSSKLNKK